MLRHGDRDALHLHLLRRTAELDQALAQVAAPRRAAGRPPRTAPRSRAGQSGDARPVLRSTTTTTGDSDGAMSSPRKLHHQRDAEPAAQLERPPRHRAEVGVDQRGRRARAACAPPSRRTATGSASRAHPRDHPPLQRSRAPARDAARAHAGQRRPEASTPPRHTARRIARARSVHVEVRRAARPARRARIRGDSALRA